MSYGVEWMGGGVVYGIVLLLLIVPEFAAIAVVVATIAVLVVALAALVGLVALAAAALASPYLLVRSVRRRLAQRRTRRIHSPSGIRSRSAAGSPAGLGRAHMTAFAHDKPDEPGAILEDATRDPASRSCCCLGGLLGIVFEVTAPGLVGPGLFGAVALVLGLYGTAQLPVTAAGAALLLLAAGLLAAELFVGSHGVLAAAGVTALVAGGLLLFDTGSDALRVSVPIAVAAGAGIGVFTLFAVGKALRLRQRPARGGSHDLVGHTGTVRVTLDPLGQVMVAGELWRARAGGDAALPAGARVRVLRVDGLTLTVEPDEKEPT